MEYKVKAIESWIEEMEFNGENMVVTKDQTRDFLSNMVDTTLAWGEANRAIGIVQGVVALTAGAAVGALVVTAGNKLKQKYEDNKDES